MKKIFTILCLLLWSNLGYGQVLISLLLGDKLNSDKLEFGLDGGISCVDLHGSMMQNPMAHSTWDFILILN